MKKTILTVFLFTSVFSSGGLLAAGTSDWAGPYVGLNVGYADGRSDWTNLYNTYEDDLVYPTDLVSNHSQGVLGGITAGYNFGLSSPYLIGIEGNFAFGGGTDDENICLGNSGYGAHCATDTNWVGDVAVRLGTTAFDRLLFFVKGGGAFGDFDYDIGNFIGFTDPPYKTSSETKIGWLAGFGVEYAAWDKMTLKLETNYMDFGEDRVGFNSNPNTCIDCYNTPFQTDISETMWVIRVGLNYRF